MRVKTAICAAKIAAGKRALLRVDVLTKEGDFV
jgi:hypothetical protein